METLQRLQRARGRDGRDVRFGACTPEAVPSAEPHVLVGGTDLLDVFCVVSQLWFNAQMHILTFKDEEMWERIYMMQC